MPPSLQPPIPTTIQWDPSIIQSLGGDATTLDGDGDVLLDPQYIDSAGASGDDVTGSPVSSSFNPVGPAKDFTSIHLLQLIAFCFR